MYMALFSRITAQFDKSIYYTLLFIVKKTELLSSIHLSPATNNTIQEVHTNGVQVYEIELLIKLQTIKRNWLEIDRCIVQYLSTAKDCNTISSIL